MKTCIKCNIKKDIECFPKSSNRCKVCINNYTKQYYNSRREIKRQTDLKYYYNNKEIISEKRKEYNLKHPNRQKEYNLKNKERANLIQNLRYKNNINDKLRKNITSRLYLELKSNINKPKTLIILGCTIMELKQHLESQFKLEMNWENHGKIWEIDHIKPCSKFDLSLPEEQQKCFHYTNLQPLFKTTEIAKQFGYINEIGNRNKLNTYYG